jgi:hypothetical protein
MQDVTVQGKSKVENPVFAEAARILSESGAGTIEEWNAERLELVLDQLIDVVLLFDSRAQPCRCGPHLGLGLRILGLLCLRCGANPTRKLVKEMAACRGGTGYVTNSLPHSLFDRSTLHAPLT